MDEHREDLASFVSFCAAVRDLLDETAADKGYHQTGLAGPNPMYAFVAETAGGPGHALGEIIYKVRRYAARRDPADLLKIAAWAYLAWRFDQPPAGADQRAPAGGSVPEGGEA